MATKGAQSEIDDDLLDSREISVVDGPSETKMKELMLNSKMAVWQLLENKIARTTFGNILNLAHQIHENEISAQMMMGVVEQVLTVLTDTNKAAISVKYITEGVVELATSEEAAPTIKAIYKSCHRTIHDPNTALFLDKIFDFLEALSRAYRGPELISSLVNGICDIMQKPDPKDQIIKAFENGKYILTTSMKKKIGNILKASTKRRVN